MRPPDPLGPDTDLLEWLLSLEPGERERAIDAMGPIDREAIDRDWALWAHEGQLWPDFAWRTWVVKGGRGFGKTLTGANWIAAAVAASAQAGGEPLSIALVGATLEETRRVMVEGRSGLLEVADGWITDWNPNLRRLTFRTGAVATLFSGASPDMLRGPEHNLAWCDELAKWEKPQETWDMLQFGLRLGDWPRALVTTTPRPGPVLKSIMEDPETVVTGGPSSANPHSSPAWRRSIYARHAGTRLGRQELEGELLPDIPGALWTVELLASCRLPLPGREGAGVGAAGGGSSTSDNRLAWLAYPPMSRSPCPPGMAEDVRGTSSPAHPPFQGGELSFSPDQSTTLVRVIVAVDPPTGDGTCGIIACAKDEAGRAHILADHSVTARRPEGWTRAAADAAAMWGSVSPYIPKPVIVAEANQGGEMVKAVFRTADPELKVKLVHARHGKSERASPVAMLFEAGKVTLHGCFPELEAQLCGMIAGGAYEGPGNSPDRADAMVWGLTELMLTPERQMPRARRL